MNAPTLIVGLGGKGSEVALRVSKMVTEEQRQRIAFAVFDTDVNELRTIREQNPFVYTIQTSTKLSVGEYLDIDTHARDNWFPVNAILNSKTLTEGAGQVRAVSRLAFETAVRAGKMEELHKAIESLYKLDGSDYQQALRVIIVSSLAGGTGSGLILPVALYIRNFLATRFHQSANITRGFFLLPEIFYGVIKGHAEQNNLKSNAYATLREIDAFLMKGDATLSKKYQDTVRVEFPGVASEEYEEYNVRPFDFCFLFDAKNINDETLNSFDEYLEHAANCIYAQSIGPMNKRSNSSEDNTIRKLAKEKGRNRYAGAGTSLLTYPTDTVRRYIALNWAKETTSSIWLMFDREFKNLKKQDAEKRRNGVHVPDRDRASSYINSVENNAKNKVPFANVIIDSCIVFSESNKKEEKNYDKYMAALKNKIAADCRAAGADSLDSSAIADAINSINPATEDVYDDVYPKFIDVYQDLMDYQKKVRKYVSTASSAIAYSIFHSGEEDEVSDDQKDFVLEKYMKSSEGNFLHPCAIRYYLYQVKQRILTDIKKTKSDIDSNNSEYIDSFLEDYFGDGNEDTPDSEYSITNRKATFMDRMKKRLSAGLESTKAGCQDFLTAIDKDKELSIRLAVLEEGLSYVSGIISAYENFFDSFESKITGMQREIREIEGRYEYQSGQAARYVCASRKCLQSMLENLPYTGGVMELDPKLCKSIYDRIRAYAKLKVKSDDGSYFQNLFDKGIIGFYENELVQIYGSEVNMDVLTAIEREAEYEAGIVNEEEIRKYVEDVINEAWNLAAPFIERQIGEEKDPLFSCTYNPELNPKDDSPRSKLVDNLLKQNGGEPDDDIPINQILFYKSFYGLRANDLSKFAPPKKGQTHDSNSGEYYKAYYELVSKIYPDPSRSLVITPHIDRWWHIVTKMPDLDDDNQERQYNRVYAAFFWGFVEGIFNLSAVTENRKHFRIVNQKIINKDVADGDKLIVSNGTECDRFDEVLDALAIFPELTDRILDYVREEIEKELYRGAGKTDNDLVVKCNTFEFPDDPDDSKPESRSIFDFPFKYRKSVRVEQYDDEDAIRMTTVVMEETEKVLRSFCSENELSETLTEFYTEHYERLLANLAKESENVKKFASDYLFTTVSSMIADKIEDAGMRQAALDLRKRTKAFTQGK
ncbi:MAG: tubulin-like doman-containing protein [Lachnospiraceae bacterium]|nr:tubulin-like doman-containing protein [Lachnospiraceae bacterium]